MLLIGCECVRQFMYYEDFEGHCWENYELLQYLRFVQYEGNCDCLCGYLDPPVSSIATCKREKRTLLIGSMSKKNEISMLKRLKEICNRHLNKYGESYGKDEELLKSKELSYNEQNCTIYRMQEKKIFISIIAVSYTHLTLPTKRIV
eukprot:TRINITY_DN12192_c0_g2_i12.p2 TRINITY_DN12192_c0_g2~~TRINITY_DN12192_c0_g2_i12.p2  ORF type:complete len:147 (-),score=22.92 TRINITY_DN12192_c0_g2_i12:45-485(-)